jgi:hypothetical protein
MLLFVRSLPALVTAVVLGPFAVAQAPCSLAWEPRDVIPGLSGLSATVHRVDPDGPGPLPEQVVAIGRFHVAGDEVVDDIAIYDPAPREWSAITNPGPSFGIQFVRANGRLVVVSTNGYREWDGANWLTIAPPLPSGGTYCIGEMVTGELVVGGMFQLTVGGPFHALCFWNGASWQPFGSPTLATGTPAVTAMATLPNGMLVVGGRFSSLGGVPCANVAWFDGFGWHAMGAGIVGGITELAANPNGLVVVKDISSNFWVWDGASWQSLPAGGPANARLLAKSGSGDVWFVGPTEIQALTASGWSTVATWTQPNWVTSAAQLANGDLVVAGGFAEFDGQATGMVAVRRNGVFEPPNVGSGDGEFASGAAGREGGFLAHRYAAVGPVPAGLVRFDGATWNWLAPLPGANQQIAWLAELRDGEVLRGGQAPTSWLETCKNGVVTPIAWPAPDLLLGIEPAADGGAWILALSGWPTGPALVYHWDGMALTIAVPPFLGYPRALAEMPNGDLVLAANAILGTTVHSLVRWNGLQLQPIAGAPNDSSQRLVVTSNGDLVSAGSFTTPGLGAARFDGTTWHPMNAPMLGTVRSIAALPDGGVVVGRSDGVSSPFGLTYIQRWDGVQWTHLGETHGHAEVAWSRTGELGVLGGFRRVADVVAKGFTRLMTSCPAGAQNLGGGCSGSSGPLTTRIEERAWLGGSFRTATGGVASNSVALGVFGASATSMPLPQLLSIGGAGCTLRAQPDVLLPLPIVHGEARAQWTLPSAPSLLGASFVQQTLVLETAAGGASALVAGDGTQLTVGAF